MSDLNDRRARKKAQTREQIRSIAHRLFAERGYDAVTIADVAREADVAVQTVFNHFATKEDLFFDGRVPWVDGPEQAVRSRGSEAPLTALRTYLVELAGALVAAWSSDERQRMVATIEASDVLRAKERENVFEAERRLAAALVEAWTDGSAPGPVTTDAETAGAVTAAIWLSSVRALILQQRPRSAAGACPRELATAVQSLAAVMLVQMETAAEIMLGIAGPAQTSDPVDTGWPRATRRAG